MSPGAGPHIVKESTGLSYRKEMSSSHRFQLFPPHSKGPGDFDTHGRLRCEFWTRLWISTG